MDRKRVRVLIVDDHELFAGTLKLLLDHSDAVEVVGASGMVAYLSKDHVDETVVDAILRAAAQ